jgi:hypothetical protein
LCILSPSTSINQSLNGSPGFSVFTYCSATFQKPPRDLPGSAPGCSRYSYQQNHHSTTHGNKTAGQQECMVRAPPQHRHMKSLILKNAHSGSEKILPPMLPHSLTGFVHRDRPDPRQTDYPDEA